MANDTTIPNWAAEDQPRKKLLLHGRKTLSNAELLAILLRSGSVNNSALELSKEILSSVSHSIDRLSRLEVEDLCKFPGVGTVKAVTLLAAMELRMRNRSDSTDIVIKSSPQLYNYIRPLIADLNHEEFWLILLNHSNKVLGRFKISQGGVTSTVVDIRIILKKALNCNATGMILCHNHPSGNTQPSPQDQLLTERLSHAAGIMDIRLLDHIIVSENSYYSFADHGLIVL